MKKLLLALLICLSSTVLFAQTLHWTPVTLPTNGMSMSAVLEIDGVEVGAEALQLEIGIFDQNGICRGAKLPKLKNGRYKYSPTIQGDYGYTYTCKIWDHTTDTERTDLTFVPDAEDPLVFSTGATWGTSQQPYVISFTSSSAQTFEKPITGYGDATDKTGYYFIASPIDGVDPTTVTGMTYPTGDDYANFDLYYFNETYNNEQWRNYKVENFNLTAGKGYLYANKNDVVLTVTGTPNPDPEVLVTLDKTAGTDMSGWNLVGNPFGVEAVVSRAGYTLNGEGYVTINEGETIGIMQGILVEATEDGQTMTFTKVPSGKSASLALNVTSESKLVDRAILNFNNGHNLSKLSFRENDSKLYMPVDGKDFAVVYSEAQGEMPVNFKAEKSGTYTLSFNTENVEMGYLHLIDNMNGNDVDLLATPSYTFDANVTDYASRFRLVFAAGNSSDDQFAFISNGEIILNGIDGNTTVQLFDVTGRMISSTNGANRISIENMAAGVYMIRLVNGSDVKTQKIVVK